MSLCVHKLLGVNFLLNQMFLEEFGHRNSLSGSSTLLVASVFWRDESIVDDSAWWLKHGSSLSTISRSLFVEFLA